MNFIKKYNINIIYILLIAIAIIFNFYFVKKVNAQRLSNNIGTSISSLRAITSEDTDENLTSVSGFGTPFDSTNYQKIRVYASITNGATWTITPMIWNSTASKWFKDSDEARTTQRDGDTWIYETRHADNVTFFASQSSTSSNMTIYVQGSNE